MNTAPKTALVTGASRGLGSRLAEILGARGLRVVLIARHGAELERRTAALRAAGIEAHAIAADVGDKHATHRIAAEATALIGPVDVLVHNASTLGPSPLSLLLDTECEDFERALQVNVLGAFRLSKAVLPGMLLRGSGTIVHVSSDAAVESYPRWGAYGASKAALDHMSRTLATELAGSGVRVLSVDPGEMDTQLHHEAVPGADRASLADPRAVAFDLADIILRPERAASGSRVHASAQRGAP